MTNTDTDTEVEVMDRDDNGEPMASRPTRRDLAERGLDVLDLRKTNDVKVSAVAGGVSFATALEVIEFAKLMAVSGKAVPKHLRANPGGCLAIAFQAVGWRMDPFQVANKSYEVNDRIGFESQLIHAVVEARAPLQHRLDCRYDGEGPTRTCTVIGHFTTGDTREYTTPMFKDIRVKNSPLWKDDPDQQLFYYASRSWARKWCPDVLMGIYSREELATDPALGREEDAAAGLHARLIGSPKSDEGHKQGHVESELEQVAANGAEAAVDAGDKTASPARRGSKKRASEAPKGKAKAAKAQKEPKEPAAAKKDEMSEQEIADIKKVKTAAQYLSYARKWITDCEDSTELFARWSAERKLRNVLGITADDRAPLDELIGQRREELEG